MRKLFTLTLALLASFSLWAVDTATWTFESNATGLTIVDAGSASTARAKYSDTGSSWTDASGTYGMYANLGSTKGSSTTITTDKEYLNISQISLKLGTSDRGKTEFALQVSPKADFSSDVTDVQARVTISGNISEITKNTAMFTKTYNIDTPISGYIRITLAQASGSNNKKMIVDDLTITYVDCQAADATFSATSTALVITNEVPAPSTTLNFTKGDNTSNPIYSVTKGGETTTDASVEGTTFTATAAGTYTITATQEADGTYCEVIKEVTITVTAEIPVTACSIEGPTAGYAGYELTYTATAANATSFAWYVDSTPQVGETDAEFVYTGVKGNHSIYATATNAYTATPVASNSIDLTVTNVSGTLVSFTVNSDANGAANLSGVLAADANAKVSLTKGSSQALDEYTGYKMDRGKYVGVTLNKGSFAEGDTVSFMVTKASGTAKLYLYNDENGTNRLDSIAFSGLTGWATFVLNQATTGVYLYRSDPDVKPYDQNPYVAAVKIIRPKEVKSVTETLSNVKIDGVSISSANLTTLLANESLDIAESYLNAPEVKFYKNIRTTYEDDTYTDKLDSIVVTAATEAGKWQAQATINEVEYTITMAKTPSYSVTYKLGSRTLGSELVIANGNPADYEDYQTIDNNGLSTFVNWYSRSDLSGDAVTMASATITKDTTFYAKFNIKYASSINMEQWILDNGAGKGSSTKTDALIAEMNSRNYSTNIAWSNDSKEEIELDSLDDGKTSRNEPYLGLKVKKSGKLINFRLKEGEYVKVKFGQVNTTPKVAINGGDYTAMTITDDVYTYNATGEDLVSIYIDVAKQAVVYKQIMINEEIQDVTLPDTPTAIDNTADEIKAVKFIENGQLFIRRGEKVYTITGEEVK